MTAVNSAKWTVDTVATLGACLSVRDHVGRTASIDGAIDNGISDLLGDETFMRIIGKRVLDSPTALDALPNLSAFRDAVVAELANLPTAVRQRAAGMWLLKQPLDDGIDNGRTYRLSQRVMALNGTHAASAMVRHDLGAHPAGGGGSIIVIPVMRRLNGGAAHGHLRLKALMHEHLDDAPGAADDIVWGTYLATADLFGLAEGIGAPASACCTGVRRGMVLNCRAATLLDRAEVFGDAAALDYARGLVQDAWAASPSEATRNVQGRLASLSGDPTDSQVFRLMDMFLTGPASHG